MKKALLVLAMLLLSVSTAFGWTMKINVGGVAYEGSPAGDTICYTSEGNIVGYARMQGNIIYFQDQPGNKLGSASRLANTWTFRDERELNIGSAEISGENIIYRDSRGVVIGEASHVASTTTHKTTTYKDGRGVVIGEANTDDMPLRPLPLESWLAKRAKPFVCLTYVTRLAWDKPAAKAGLRAGDILIGFAGDSWTLFDVMEANGTAMHKKVKAKLDSMRSAPGATYIVYRPAPGENGMAKGTILKLAPMPAGKRGYYYLTSDQGLTFSRRNSASYAEQIKKLHLSSAPASAPVRLPNADAYRKDERPVPGAHQEFCEVVEGNAVRSKWAWISDKNGSMISDDGAQRLREQEQMKRQPVVAVYTYPLAKVFVSTTAADGSGDPHANSSFTYVGMADGYGVFTGGGKTGYVLPVGAKCLAFSKEGKEWEFDDASVGKDPVPPEQDPVLLALPEARRAQLLSQLQQFPPELRSKMLWEFKGRLRSSSGANERYVTYFGYFPVVDGQTSYKLVRKP